MNLLVFLKRIDILIEQCGNGDENQIIFSKEKEKSKSFSFYNKHSN